MNKKTFDRIMDTYAQDMSNMENIVIMLIDTLADTKDDKRRALMRFYLQFIKTISMGIESKTEEKTKFMVDMMITSMARRLDIIDKNDIAKIRVSGKWESDDDTMIECSFQTMTLSDEEMQEIEDLSQKVSGYEQHFVNPTGEKVMA